MADEEIDEGGKEGEGEDVDTLGEYEGERNREKQRYGRGRALLPNQDYFIGYYKEGLRHGMGQYVFKGRAQYFGQYKAGVKDGLGIFNYPDGSAYDGQWKDDKRHGKGIYLYSQGDTYIGDWEEDERHGLGTYIYKKSGVSYYGIWKKGKMEGKGILKYPTNKYYGRFTNNMPIGKGMFVFENYCIQKGHYVHVEQEKSSEGRIEEEKLMDETEEEKMSPREGYPKGLVAMWRPREIIPYSRDLIPPDPKLPYKPQPLPTTLDELPFETDNPKTDGEGALGISENGEKNEELEEPSQIKDSVRKSIDLPAGDLKPIQEESSPENTLDPTDDEDAGKTSPDLTDGE